MSTPAGRNVFVRSLGPVPMAAAWAAVVLLLPGCGGMPIGTASGAALGAMAPAERVSQPPLTPQQADNIRFFSTILFDPATERSIRVGAAERLRDMNLAEAVQPLAEGLRSGDAPVRAAVVEAMTSARAPIQGLLEPGIVALRSAASPMRESLALALARYNDPALRMLKDVATDQRAPFAERMNCIAAIGAFRTRAAAVELMSLLDMAERESPEAVEAVCLALARGTGLPYGAEPDAWRRWWAEASDQPQEEWLTKMVQRLSEQLAASAQQILRERQGVQSMERRLVETYRELFHLVQPEDQLRLLPVLLQDQLAGVREFGMDRIGRMLRDSTRLPEEIQHQIAERLHDDTPALRLHAARLLDQLNYEPASERIARRLGVESSPEVAAGLLDILARRPTRSAVEHVLPWLADRAQSDRAATVLWEILLLGEIPEEQMIAMRDAARDSAQRSLTPPCARLFVRLADDDELVPLQRLLDSDDPIMRRSAAEGFFRRGIRQPLIDRANDELLYPFAVRLLAKGPTDLAGLRLLGSLLPNEQNRVVWQESVVRLYGNLAADKLIEADDLIQLWSDSGPLRLETLARSLALPADSLPADLRAELAMRLARLHLQLDQPQRAHETLEAANGVLAGIPGARTLRFEVAALAGHYGIAAQINQEPGPWVALLSGLTDRNPERAVALHMEIMRRFEGQLNGEHRATMEAVTEKLRSRMPPPEPAAS